MLHHSGWACSETWIQWLVCVCVSVSRWDTVIRELCWLVEGPGEQKGNNTSSFPPFSLPLVVSLSAPDILSHTATLSLSLSLLFLYLPLFRALSRRDEVRQGRVSGMASRHQRAATVPALLMGGTGRANMITVPGNSQWKQWTFAPIRRQTVIIKQRVCACSDVFGRGFEFVQQYRCGY